MKKIITISALAALAFSAMAQPKLRQDNIDEVLRAMTTEEKVTLLVGAREPFEINGESTGIAEIIPCAAGATRCIPRLGIPQTVVDDGPAGIRVYAIREGDPKTYYATAFPVGTALASSWDENLVQKLTTAMGNEVREYGVDVILAPAENIQRNILCGRNFEYFSEDPLVSGKMAAAYVRGIQSNGVGACIKHFIANNQETNRTRNDARISQRALRELYLKTFEISVKESQPWTIMSSYNAMNGPYTQQNYDLLTTVLRDEWGFKGIVMTDWSCKDGTVKAAKAGNDLMQPGYKEEYDRILSAVTSGEISQKELDTNARRMLEYIVKTPSFKGYKFSNTPDTKAHAQLVREAGPQVMVLLKNEGVLPLKNEKNVALLGVGSYDFIAGGTGSGIVFKEYTRNIQEGLEMNGFKVDQSVASWYKKYIAFTEDNMILNEGKDFTWGKPGLKEMPVNAGLIAKTVETSDVAVVTISRNAGEENDRKAEEGDFKLNDTERHLIEDTCDKYHSAGKKVIVVLNIGGVIETASWKHLPDAILLAWQPGMEGGAAVADVLCGKANPSGKLAVTFPLSYYDSPVSLNFPAHGVPERTGWEREPLKDLDYTNYEEGIYVGYRYFGTANKPVSYPFGFGLSYTTFEYSHPVVKATADGFTASITVKNTGSVAGREAVQLYVTAPSGGMEKPALELKSFAKTKELAPGESETLTMKVDKYTLASFNASASQWETAEGTYNVHFAASVQDIRANAEYVLKTACSWPVHDVLAPEQPLNEVSLK